MPSLNNCMVINLDKKENTILSAFAMYIIIVITIILWLNSVPPQHEANELAFLKCLVGSYHNESDQNFSLNKEESFVDEFDEDFDDDML